jgi:hypothetical protein
MGRALSWKRLEDNPVYWIMLQRIESQPEDLSIN